jgi:hypothetical protein
MSALPAGTQQALSLFDDTSRAATALFARYDESDLRRLVDLLTRYRNMLADQATAIRAGNEPP